MLHEVFLAVIKHWGWEAVLTAFAEAVYNYAVHYRETHNEKSFRFFSELATKLFELRNTFREKENKQFKQQ